MSRRSIYKLAVAYHITNFWSTLQEVAASKSGATLRSLHQTPAHIHRDRIPQARLTFNVLAKA